MCLQVTIKGRGKIPRKDCIAVFYRFPSFHQHKESDKKVKKIYYFIKIISTLDFLSFFVSKYVKKDSS